MRKFIFIFLCTFALLSISVVPVRAEDLFLTYRLALDNDPTFKAAEAEWLAAKENLPISQANLLPSLSGTGSISRQHFSIEGIREIGLDKMTKRYYNDNASYGLTLTQPIVNYSSWATVKNASALVKQAQAKYFAAAQDLILRTATAYFNVLQANDVLRVTRAEKKSVASQLQNNKQRYNVGLLPITDVYEAQAQYDSVVAQEITAENDLANSLERLREIIGTKPDTFALLGPNPPLLTPRPANVDEWIAYAEKQNYDLLQTHYATIAAKDNIKIQAGGNLPVIEANGDYRYSYDNDPYGIDAFSRDKIASVGLNLNLPIFQGGLVLAKVRQANELYLQTYSQQEVMHRQVISLTRQSYLGVIDAISKVRADRQAIISNTSAYNSMLASYKYGTRTITDVLSAQSNLYQAEKTYAQDQYTYIIQTLTLKQAAGILNVNDIQGINTWLQPETKLLNAANGFRSAKIDNKKPNDVKNRSYLQKRERSIKKSLTAQQKNGNLFNLNPQHYVIQLAAADSERDANAFIHKHAAEMKMYVIKVNKNGRTWFKIVTGDYISYVEARSAKEKIASDLHESAIWVRKVADLQKEVRS